MKPRNLPSHGPIAVHLIDNPAEPARRRSSMRLYVPGITAGALAREAWGKGVYAAAILPGRGGRRGAVAKGEELDGIFLGPGEVVHVLQLPTGTEFLIGVLIDVLVAAAVAAVGLLLFPPPDDPTIVESDTSKTYGWNGIQTNYKAAGSTVPLVYGRHGVGGLVISQEIIELIDGGLAGPNQVQEYLRLLILVAQGPIKSIGGIEVDSDSLEGDNLPAGLLINGNAVGNLDGVRAAVRLGTLDQLPILGFASPTTIYPVGLAIENWDKAGLKITDWSEAVSFDMPEEGDFITIRINFPNGQYQIDGSGAVQNATTRIQVRYQELVAGVPTGPVVDWGGGTDFIFADNILTSFGRNLRLPLYDPATVTWAGTSQAVSLLDSASNFMGSGAGLGVNVNGFNNATSTTFGLWIRPQNAGGDFEELFSFADLAWGIPPVLTVAEPTSVKGIYVRLIAGRVQVYWGTGATFDSATTNVAVKFQELTQIVVTWSLAATIGGLHRLRVYQQGAKILEVETSLAWHPPTVDPTIRIASLNTSPYQLPFRGEIELVRVWAREVDAAAITAEFIPKNPEAIAAADLLVYYDFSGATLISGTTYTVPDLSTHGNDGSVNIVVGSLIVGMLPGSSTGSTIKRGQYRVSVQRNTGQQDTTNLHGNTTFHSLGVQVDRKFSYPDVALLALEIPAQSEASGGSPRLLIELEGKLVPIWDGVSNEFPNFTLGYTATPWRQLPDLYLSERGLGAYHKPKDFDWQEVEDAAIHAETLIDDGTPARLPVGIAFGAPSTHSDPALFTVGFLEIELTTGESPDTWRIGTTLKVTGFGATLIGDGWPADDDRVVIKYIDYGETELYRCEWPTGLAFPPTGSAAPSVPGTLLVNSQEPRHECNIVFDRSNDNIWDAIQRVSRAGRGSSIPFGSRIFVRPQKAEAPVHVFHDGNIVKGSLSVSGITPENDFNSATVEILNASLDWERDPVSRQAPSLKSGDSFTREVRKAFKFEGVTSVGQASRELDVLLLSNDLLRATVLFEAWLDAIHLMPGDVFYLSSQIPDWGYGGRVVADSANASEIALDVDVVLAAATTYVVALRLPSGVMTEANISTVAGSYSAGTTLTLATALDVAPIEGLGYVLGPLVDGLREFRVVRIGLAPDFRRRIQAVQYSAAVYDPVETLIDAQGFNAAESLNPPSKGGLVSIENVAALEVNSTDSITGAMTVGVAISWTVDPRDTPRVASFVIFVRKVDIAADAFEQARAKWEQVGTADKLQRTKRITGGPVAVGQILELVVQPISVSGGTASQRMLPNVRVSMRGHLVRAQRTGTLDVDRYGSRVRFAFNPANGRQAAMEVRQGGWLLGMPVAAPEGGSREAWVDEFADASDNAAGDGAMLMVSRERLSSGEFASHFTRDFTTDELHEEDAQADTIAVRQEDFGFTSVPTGGTGAPVLTDLIISGGLVVVDPVATGLEPSWASSTFDTSRERRYRVNFSVEAWQVHPASAENFPNEPGDGFWAQNWTGEGPIFEPWDSAFASNIQPHHEFRYSSTSSPSAEDWQPFRPGVYFARSFQFRIRFRRFDDTFSIELGKAAFRIHPLPLAEPDDLDGGTF